MNTLTLIFMGLVFFTEPHASTGELSILFPNPNTVHVKEQGTIYTKPLARHRVLLTYRNGTAGCLTPPLVLSDRFNPRTISLQGNWTTQGVTFLKAGLSCSDPAACGHSYRTARNDTHWAPALSTLMDALKAKSLPHSRLDPNVKNLNTLDRRLSGGIKVPSGVVYTRILWGEDKNIKELQPRLPALFNFSSAGIDRAVAKAVAVDIEIPSGGISFVSNGDELLTVPSGLNSTIFIYNFPENTPLALNDDCSPATSTLPQKTGPSHFRAYFELTVDPAKVAENPPLPYNTRYDDASCSPAFEVP